MVAELPVDGSVSLNEHDMIGLFTVKVTMPLPPVAISNVEGQVLFEISTPLEALVIIVTVPFVAPPNPMLGNTPIDSFNDWAPAPSQIQEPVSGAGVGTGVGVGVGTGVGVGVGVGVAAEVGEAAEVGVAVARGVAEACGVAGAQDAATSGTPLVVPVEVATGHGKVQVPDPDIVFDPTATAPLHCVPAGRFGRDDPPTPLLQPINAAIKNVRSVVRALKCLIRVSAPPKKKEVPYTHGTRFAQPGVRDESPMRQGYLGKIIANLRA
jgi:hypothetical protein